MPRLLASYALDGPPVHARWTAILALAMTAAVTDWRAAWDATRSLAPTTSDRSTPTPAPAAATTATTTAIRKTKASRANG